MFDHNGDSANQYQKFNGFVKFFVAALIVGSLLQACQPKMGKLLYPEKGLTVAFYNVENLFDTINDPTINDEEFLPESKVGWNSEKYTHKLHQTARVIAAMDTLDFPHIIGLAEMENGMVVNALSSEEAIKKAGYNVIHFEGNDPRGIEVVMMYRQVYFKPLYAGPVMVSEATTGKSYRHILYVKGVVATGDTLNLFVNHWPSRYGGREETEGARRFVASTLKSVTDSILGKQPNSNILIMGDLNDNPTDSSLVVFLQAKNPANGINDNGLYNLSLKPYAAGEGTLFYQNWDMFDQIIVSANLIKPAKGNIKAGDQLIVKKDWMLFKGSNGIAKPNRTMSGTKYFGGFSDHLPVMVKLFRKDK